MNRSFRILSILIAAPLLGVCVAAMVPAKLPPLEVSPATITSAEVVVSPLAELSLDQEPVEREMILDLVRQHRRGASEPWRRALADAVYGEAVAAGIDPLMVAAIVARESSFQSEVVSSAGAVGLMQIRPFVAEDVAQRYDVEWNGLDTLHQPDANVRLGVRYYLELVNRFEGDEQVALTAYNRGPSVVSSEMRRGSFRSNEYSTDILDMYEKLSAERAQRDVLSL